MKSKGEFWIGKDDDGTGDIRVNHNRCKMVSDHLCDGKRYFMGTLICGLAVKKLMPFALKLKPGEQIRVKATFEVKNE